MDYWNIQSWHPINSASIDTLNRNNWNKQEFNTVVNQINKFRSELSSRSSDCVRSYLDINSQIYEVDLYCSYDPSHHIHQYFWVDSRDITSWWFSDDIINLLTKYGWCVTKLN